MEKNQVQSSYILAADIGGSHITAGICHVGSLRMAPGTVSRGGVQSKGAASDILISWSNTIEEVLFKAAGTPICGLSVAMPGPFDYKNGISLIKGLSKYEALYNQNIKQYFADFLKLDPGMVRFRNDAESAIAGEVMMGAGKGYRQVIGITLGTGFGSAFSSNKITDDINLGSEPYKETIADDYFSTRWFIKRYADLTGILLKDGVRELAELAETSPAVRDIFTEFATNMSGFLSEPITRFAPEALIVCGNIARASRLFVPTLARLLSPLPILVGDLNEDASLVGAAAMFANKLAPINPVNQ